LANALSCGLTTLTSWNSFLTHPWPAAPPSAAPSSVTGSRASSPSRVPGPTRRAAVRLPSRYDPAPCHSPSCESGGRKDQHSAESVAIDQERPHRDHVGVGSSSVALQSPMSASTAGRADDPRTAERAGRRHGPGGGRCASSARRGQRLSECVNGMGRLRASRSGMCPREGCPLPGLSQPPDVCSARQPRRVPTGWPTARESGDRHEGDAWKKRSPAWETSAALLKTIRDSSFGSRRSGGIPLVTSPAHGEDRENVATPSPERIGADMPGCHAKGRISRQHGCVVLAGRIRLRPLEEEDVPLPGALEDYRSAMRDALEDVPGLAGHFNPRLLHSIRVVHQ